MSPSFKETPIYQKYQGGKEATSYFNHTLSRVEEWIWYVEYYSITTDNILIISHKLTVSNNSTTAVI